MTNFVPPNHTLILKGFRNGTSQQEIRDFCKNLPVTPDLVGFNVKRDEKAVDSKYNYMAYLNYASEEQARLAGDSIKSEIKTLKEKGDRLDLSHVIPVLASELSSLVSQQPFALWVGNIFDASEDTLKQAFSRYGVLATDAVGVKSCKENRKRYAFVNFVAYQDAKAAQQACDNGAVVLSAASSAPAMARPCASVALVDAVLDALRRREPAALSLAEAGRIAQHVEGAAKTKTKLDDWLDLLRRLPRVLAIHDVAKTISLAKAPAPAPLAASCLRGPKLLASPLARPASMPALLPAPASSGAPPPGRAVVRGVEGNGCGDAVVGWECLICFGPGMGKAALVPCGHTFCRGCCAGLVREGIRACPVCRAVVEGVLVLHGA